MRGERPESGWWRPRAKAGAGRGERGMGEFEGGGSAATRTALSEASAGRSSGGEVCRAHNARGPCCSSPGAPPRLRPRRPPFWWPSVTPPSPTGTAPVPSLVPSLVPPLPIIDVPYDTRSLVSDFSSKASGRKSELTASFSARKRTYVYILFYFIFTYLPRKQIHNSPNGLRPVFCSSLKFGQAILVRVLMLNFCIKGSSHYASRSKDKGHPSI